MGWVSVALGVVLGEERAEPEGKAFDLEEELNTSSHLC